MRRAGPAILCLALLAAGAAAVGEEAGPGEPARYAEARTEFEAGMAAVRREAWTEALERFDRSLALRPTAVAEYNRAVCLSRLGRHAEALPAFEGYLRSHGAELGPRRRAAVEAEIARLEAEVGRVVLELREGLEATLLVDGEAAGRLPRRDPLILTPGEHTLEVRHDEGGAPLRLTLSVAAGRTDRVRVEPPRPPEMGGLDLRVRPVGAEVLVDGEPVGTSPFAAPLVVRTGPHRVVARRAGYDDAAAEVVVGPGAHAEVSLRLSRAPSSSEGLEGRLELAVSPEAAAEGGTTLVDGEAWRGEPLPAGPHEVEVLAEGFEPWRSVVRIRRGELLRVDVTLEPSAVRAEVSRRRGAALRAAAWATAGVALAGLASSLGVLLWNDGRYGDWQREATALEDVGAADRDRRLVANAELLDSIHAVDVVGWSVLGLAAVAVAASVTCFVLGFRDGSGPALSAFALPSGLWVGLSLTAPE